MWIKWVNRCKVYNKYTVEVIVIKIGKKYVGKLNRLRVLFLQDFVSGFQVLIF